MSAINRFFYIALITLVVLTSSCSGRKNKTVNRDLIPEKELIPLLQDVYLADGLLNLPKINFYYLKGDTLDSYIDVIKAHGFTKKQMDNTMMYYFMKDPKKLVKIYDKVLGRLSEMESRVDKEVPEATRMASNIWPGHLYYLRGYASGSDTSEFNFPVNITSECNLRFTLTVYPDDQSVKPELGLYFSHTDSAGKDRTLPFSTLPFIKDGRPHSYDIKLVQKLPLAIRLKGWFIDRAGKSPEIRNHYIVEDIFLIRSLMQ